MLTGKYVPGSVFYMSFIFVASLHFNMISVTKKKPILFMWGFLQ